MWLLIISHPSVKFDSHRSRENEFITFFICYMTLCDHVINRLCDFVNKKPAYNPPLCQVLSHSSCGSRNITFFISHVITWSRAKIVKRLDGWCSFTIILYLFKFGSHSLQGSGDILFFICRVTLCGQVIARSRNFPGCGPSA